MCLDGHSLAATTTKRHREVAWRAAPKARVKLGSRQGHTQTFFQLLFHALVNQIRVGGVPKGVRNLYGTLLDV